MRDFTTGKPRYIIKRKVIHFTSRLAETQLITFLEFPPIWVEESSTATSMAVADAADEAAATAETTTAMTAAVERSVRADTRPRVRDTAVEEEEEAGEEAVADMQELPRPALLR